MGGTWVGCSVGHDTVVAVGGGCVVGWVVVEVVVAVEDVEVELCVLFDDARRDRYSLNESCKIHIDI